MPENFDFICEVLKFWDKLNSEEQEMLINNIMTKQYSRGENIHGGENDCIGVILIKSGELRTYILSEDGREITLYRLFREDVCILSASCAINNITFDVHIDAELDTEVLIINNAVYAKLAAQNIYVENFSLKEAVDRFSHVMWAMEQILFMSFDKRLASFLVDEVSRSSSDLISLTHDQIARYIGSAREVVSRMLKYFAAEGYVKQYRGGIKVIDKRRLRELTLS